MESCSHFVHLALALFRVFLLWNRNPYILRLMLAGATIAYVVCLTFAALFVKDFHSEHFFPFLLSSFARFGIIWCWFSYFHGVSH